VLLKSTWFDIPKRSGAPRESIPIELRPLVKKPPAKSLTTCRAVLSRLFCRAVSTPIRTQQTCRVRLTSSHCPDGSGFQPLVALGIGHSHFLPFR
jgi:hypothetical protein